MPYKLSFDDNVKDARPIAFVTGGEHNDSILSLVEEKHNNKKDVDKNEIIILIENLYRQMNGHISFTTLEQLKNAIVDRKRPANRELAIHYDHAMKILENGKSKEIILEDGVLVPMFDNTMSRQVCMVGGMSGSGKSYYTANLCRTYKKQFPNNKLILFSNKSSDPAFDALSYVERVVIDEDLLAEPITLEELRNTMVIYDDVEYTSNKELDKELDRIRDLILQQGRSFKTTFVYVSHQFSNYRQTRTILNEAHSFTFFPATATKHSMKYMFDKYLGYDRKTTDKLMRLPSRWVTVTKSPPSALYANGAFLIEC
tara:strand:+ start:1564 stop:2505 length:942 start_codon:yes stop_codon:yes gene_type:complete